jgi:hypothetical protein
MMRLMERALKRGNASVPSRWLVDNQALRCQLQAGGGVQRDCRSPWANFGANGDGFMEKYRNATTQPQLPRVLETQTPAGAAHVPRRRRLGSMCGEEETGLPACWKGMDEVAASGARQKQIRVGDCEI